jgi:hypothetical protein
MRGGIAIPDSGEDQPQEGGSGEPERQHGILRRRDVRLISIDRVEGLVIQVHGDRWPA